MAGSIGTGGAAFGGSTLPKVAGVEGSGVNSEINVTPMIDVMLVLLIIFMVITPTLAGYAAVLPKAYTADPEKDDRVTLGIDTQGRYYLEGGTSQGIPIAPDQLATALRQAYATRPEDHVLYLKADVGVAYSVVLSAIDAARIAGVRRIGAITEAASTGGETQGGGN